MNDMIKDEQINTKENNFSSSSVHEESERKNSILKNGIINTFYQVLVIITPLITTPYVSRILGADGIGIYSYTHSLVTYFVLFAGLGTISYGTREVARRRLDKKDYSSAFWEIEFLTIITSIICITIWLTLSFFYIEYRIYLLVCTLYILATLFDISWLYAGLEKFKYTVIINCFFKILGIISIFLFVKTSNDVKNYILINACIIVFGNASMWLFLPKVLCKTKIQFKNIIKHLKETLIYFIPTIATTIYTVLDKSLLGIICKSDELNGYYEQGTKILNISKTISFIGVIGVVMPRMSFLYKLNDDKQIKNIVHITLNITLFLSISITLGIISIADIFVPMFFGDGYDEVVKIIYCMMPLCIIISISYLLGGLYYTPNGKRKLSSLFLVISSLCNLCLNLILIPFWNIYGAIISSIVAESLIVVLYMIFSKKFITLKQLVLFSWKKIIAGLCMCLIIYFTKKIPINLFENENYNLLIKNILCIFLGGITYCLILIIVRDEIVSLFINKVSRRK